jgi:hypothetical protein
MSVEAVIRKVDSNSVSLDFSQSIMTSSIKEEKVKEVATTALMISNEKLNGTYIELCKTISQPLEWKKAGFEDSWKQHLENETKQKVLRYISMKTVDMFESNFNTISSKCDDNFKEDFNYSYTFFEFVADVYASNACDSIMNRLANDKFEASIHVELSLKDQNIICLSIEDNGMGIPDKIMHTIFQDQISSKTNNNDIPHNRGCGLGLTSVRNFTSNLNGKCGCTNKADKGAIFWFEATMEKCKEVYLSPSYQKYLRKKSMTFAI